MSNQALHGVLIALVVIDHRGRIALRPAERRLKALASGELGVCLGKEVRGVRLFRLPGKNFPVALVDHRVPAKAEAIGWARNATEVDLLRVMATGLPTLAADLMARLRVLTMG